MATGIPFHSLCEHHLHPPRKTLHDARRKLRATLADAGHDLDEFRHTGGQT